MIFYSSFRKSFSLHSKCAYKTIIYKSVEIFQQNMIIKRIEWNYTILFIPCLWKLASFQMCASRHTSYCLSASIILEIKLFNQFFIYQLVIVFIHGLVLLSRHLKWLTTPYLQFIGKIFRSDFVLNSYLNIHRWFDFA